jgi:hypothetical protein
MTDKELKALEWCPWCGIDKVDERQTFCCDECLSNYVHDVAESENDPPPVRLVRPHVRSHESAGWHPDDTIEKFR